MVMYILDGKGLHQFLLNARDGYIRTAKGINTIQKQGIDEKVDALIEMVRADAQASMCNAIAAVVENSCLMDAVQVIRCKDCKFATMTTSGKCKYCSLEEGEILYRDGDYYCADAERKEPDEKK